MHFLIATFLHFIIAVDTSVRLEKVAFQGSAGGTISPWPVRHRWGTKTVSLGAKLGERARVDRRHWTAATDIVLGSGGRGFL